MTAHPKRLSADEIANLAETARLINQLFDSGAISAAERAKLLAFAWDEQAADRTHAAGRGGGQHHKLLVRNLDMNPTKIIQMIEQHQKVMEAQAARLMEMSPARLQVPQGADGPANAADLLEVALRGQLQGATDVLRALVEVEAKVRAESAPQSSPHPEQRESEVIEGEAVVIRDEGAQ